MCVLRDDPFVGRGTPLALVPQMPAFSGVIDHGTGIFRVVQDIQDGKARISCKAVRGSERIVANTFQNVCVGFEILARKFPENISFKIMG